MTISDFILYPLAGRRVSNTWIAEQALINAARGAIRRDAIVEPILKAKRAPRKTKA
jgi:hypothetical protein